MRWFAAILVLPWFACQAGERAILTNGFRIYAERHEKDGNIVRLISGSSVLEMPSGQIVRFDTDDYVPAREAAPVAVPQVSTPSKPAAVTPAEIIAQAAERHGLPPELVRSVAKAESGLRQQALSPVGAIGIMQLMPGTAAAMGADPHDAEQNVDAGTRFLRDLLIRYDGSTHRALAAYNAGPGAVDRHNGIPPYRETQLYVDRVLGEYLRQTRPNSTIRQRAE